jgi:hypothetical protein
LENLHRRPVSRKRQSKKNPVHRGISGPPSSWGNKHGDLALQVGRSQIDIKIWPPVLWDLGPGATALAIPRGSFKSKLQAHSLVREGAPHQEARNYQTEKKILVMGYSWEPDTKIDWPTDRRL